MTNANDPISILHNASEKDIVINGLTKREYFAIHSDIPWETVLKTLDIKYPEKNGKHTIESVIKYQACIKVMQADALITALNQSK